MRGVNYLTRALAGIGALNWGLVALAEFDLVATVFGLEFGQINAATRMVYGLVGLAGIWELVRLFASSERASQPVPASRAG